jgi:hypothetical protein
MESWRDILIYLRTNYPVGLVNSMQSLDHFDFNHIGTLNRVKSMRNELQEVVRYKIDKLKASSEGLILASTLSLNGSQQTPMKDEFDYQRNWNSVNLYSQNIPSELGMTKSPPVVEDLSKYDSLSLGTSPSPGILVNSDLGFADEFNFS